MSQNVAEFVWKRLSEWGSSRTFATNTRARAREADDGGKDEDCGRLAAWAGLDLGDDIAGEVLRCPAERVDGREHSLLPFDARH